MQSDGMNVNNDKNGNAPGMIVMMAVLGLAYFFSNFHRLSLGVVSDEIQIEFQLTTTQLGLLGSALFYPYAIMQLPAGFIGDRVPTNKLIAFSCILMAYGTLLFSLANAFWMLVIARAITGAATALVYVPALAAIRRKFGDAVYGSMVGIIVSLGQIGAVCASAPLQFVSDIFGWRKAFLVIGCITVLLSLACWFFIDSASDAIDEKSSTSANNVAQNVEDDSSKSVSKTVLQPFAMALIAWFFITGGSRLSFQSLWGAKFFTGALEMSDGMSSIMLMCISIGCIFGASILGKISDVIGSIKTALISSVVFVCTWLVYAMFDTESSVIFVGIAGIFLGAFGAGGFTVGFSCISLFAEKKYTGTITGIVNFFTFIGSAVFTQVCGNFMEILPVSGVMAQFQVLLICFAVMSLVVTVLLWFAGKEMNVNRNKQKCIT